MSTKEDFLVEAYLRLRSAVAARKVPASDEAARSAGFPSPVPILPPQAALAAGFAALPLPPADLGNSSSADHHGEQQQPHQHVEYLRGRGPAATLAHLHAAIVPALSNQALSARYYGFVTGGALPVAEAADNVVSALDQNVHAHQPESSLAAAVEDAALTMLAHLLRLRGKWAGRVVSTGATSSNILGLACGREAVVARRLPPGHDHHTVARAGLLAACAAAGVREIQVLTSMGHASLSKAASVVGLGHASVKELPLSADEPWRLDIDAVERELAREGAASIIAVSAGEVNTGRFATASLQDMQRLRNLADRHGAWIHVDGAFGIFARSLPDTDEFSTLRAYTDGLDLADSITADAHKLLNVPYDAGIFLCQDAAVLRQVFAAPNAAYLAIADHGIPNPLENGLENSRRFRALPIYAVLLSEGQEGLAQMLARMVRLAREIACFVRDSPDYDWLPSEQAQSADTHIIVLFKAKNPQLNEVLVEKVNETGAMFVSGTRWKGQKACRIAVANWQVDVERDLAIVKSVLLEVARGF